MGDNENDSYSESSTQSWGSRLMDSIKGVGIGFILFILSFVVLWWNEGRSVHTYKSLKEGKGATVEAKADSVDSGNEGKLVHVSGMASTEETLSDSVFNVRAPKALSLRRTVTMYQWQENCKSESEKNLGGSKTTTTKCTYEKAWAGKTDSSKFKKPTGHKNPEMLYESQTVVADSAKIGAYKLPKDLTGRLAQFSALENSEEILRQVKAVAAKPAAVTGEGIYIGSNASAPQIGDYRIKFEAVRPMDASVIAVQQGGTFAPFQAKAGDQIYMITAGSVTAQQMFKQAESANATLTWILRLVGWLLMAIGIYMLFSPFVTLLDVVPFLGSILGFGIGLASAVLSLSLSLVTIAIAWMFYRPVLSVILIAAVVGIVFFFRQRAAQKKAAAG